VLALGNRGSGAQCHCHLRYAHGSQPRYGDGDHRFEDGGAALLDHGSTSHERRAPDGVWYRARTWWRAPSRAIPAP
jgi:hypothetical protein